jgi:hypothetical protein
MKFEEREIFQKLNNTNKKVWIIAGKAMLFA